MKRRTIIMVLVVAVAMGGLIAGTYGHYLNGRSPVAQGCTKPPGGFLIIASNTGYNDSVDHGSNPWVGNPWPVINVQKGLTVTITFCNTDRQAHSVQITHYLDRDVNSLSPGQVVTVSFVADQSGRFAIYCSIFCTVHWAMEAGQLIVT